MVNQPLNGRSVEYADNRISMFSAQMGKCAITGEKFIQLEDIHCHHITPRGKGGSDQYHNLLLVLPQVHRLIHATQADTIAYYLEALKLKKKQLERLNKYREQAGNAIIEAK
jgi:5-methylcytosine-specific restriction endonuclease McrA